MMRLRKTQARNHYKGAGSERGIGVAYIILLLVFIALWSVALAEPRPQIELLTEVERFQALRMLIGFVVGVIAQGIVMLHGTKVKRNAMAIAGAVLFSGLVSASAGGVILATFSRNLILELLVAMLAGVSGGFAAVRVLDSWQAKVTGLRFIEEDKEVKDDPTNP